MAGRPNSLEAKRIADINKSFLAGLKLDRPERRRYPHVKWAIMDFFRSLKNKNNTRARNSGTIGSRVRGTRRIKKMNPANAEKEKKILYEESDRAARELKRKIEKNKKELQKQQALLRNNGRTAGAASASAFAAAEGNAILENTLVASANALRAANAAGAHANGNGNNAAGVHANGNGNNAGVEANTPLGLPPDEYEALTTENKIKAIKKEIKEETNEFIELVEMMQRLQLSNARNPWLRPNSNDE